MPILNDVMRLCAPFSDLSLKAVKTERSMNPTRDLKISIIVSVSICLFPFYCVYVYSLVSLSVSLVTPADGKKGGSPPSAY